MLCIFEMFASLMSVLGYGAIATAAAAVLYANLPTRLTIGAVAPTAKYLAEAALAPIESEKSFDPKKTVAAGELWNTKPVLVMAVRRPGCILCRDEAGALSELKPLADKANVRLVAVVHETLGVDAFKPYFKGDVYYDKEKRFYGPNQRWLPVWMGMLRFGTYKHVYSSKKRGFDGNLVGEGRLLGGVFLLHRHDMLFSHLEEEWGDHADIAEVKKALEKLL